VSRQVRPFPSPRARSARGRAALGAALVLAVAAGTGCGGDDDEAPAGSTAAGATTPSTVAAPTATGPVNGAIVPPPPTTTSADGGLVVSEVTDDPIATGVDERRGIRIAVETIRGGDEDGEVRAAFTVTGKAPAAVRRRLARTSGYMLNCALSGAPRQGAELRPTGSRTAVPVGTTRRTGGFLEAPKGRTVAGTVRSCALFLSKDPRGSTTRTYESGSPERAYVTVRFR